MRAPSGLLHSTKGIRNYSVALAAGAVLGLLSLTFALSSSAQKKPNDWGDRSAKWVQIPGATRAGSEACQACHAEVAGNFRHAFHAQQGVECEDCHGPGSLHIEGGGDIAKIISFRLRSAHESNAVCLSCHGRDEKIRNWLAGSHSSNGVRCTECHQTHAKAVRAAALSHVNFDRIAADRSSLVESVVPEGKIFLESRAQANENCLRCHQSVRGEMSLPYHHPLREGKVGCQDCHDPHGGPGANNLRTANANQLCLSCHAQYRGPFAYQHPPVTENCMICHTVHGSPNTNLLNVSEPALCLQCHAGHHNGASLPLPDRCTNCHGSIHGTDVPTPSGGSRFMDKGPSEADLVASARPAAARVTSHSAVSASMPRGVPSHVPTYGMGVASGALGMVTFGYFPPLSGGNMQGGSSGPAGTEAGAGNAAYSITPGAYRFVDGSGFLGRVGEYDTLQQSAGADAVTAFVSPQSHLTVVSRAMALSGDDYSAASQLTVGERLQIGFVVRSFVQQQDHYPFYAFPVLDVPPGATSPPDTTTDLIPSDIVFGVKRRLGNAYARVKVPKLPVHLFVTGDWQARVGLSQLAYLDENTFDAQAPTQFCGQQCHYQSGGSPNAQFQGVNYTTRNIGGGADLDLGPVRLTWEHKFSSFNDRLIFPTGTFTGPFTPEADSFGYSSANPPPSGPTPGDVAAGNYALDIPAPNQYHSDSVRLTWTASPKLTFNGNVSYTRLLNLFTHYSQNSLDSDETLTWHPLNRLRVTADYHQQNLLNKFTPFYSLYGNVSYHEHGEGLRLDYELPKGFDVEAHYKRSGITRSNAPLWQLGPFGVGRSYSVDNTDLLSVVPSSFSNTTGLALRYHDGGLWSVRTGYEWTGTHDPGYLIVPQSNNRTFADLWFTPTQKLVFSNDISIIVHNAFRAVPLPNTPGAPPSPSPFSPGFGINIAGLPPTFQRRNRFYTDTASATLRFVPGWNLGLGYSYQHNYLTTYMAFQNDSLAGYILDEPAVPYKQITQAYWGESTYTFKQRLGLNLRLTYNSARSGFRPDVNPNDAAQLGNQFLMMTPGAFNPGLFAAALNNLQFSATQVSQVIVPQWIGQSQVLYHFPNKFEGGAIFYYGSYRDQLNPNLNGVLRTFNVYVGRTW